MKGPGGLNFSLIYVVLAGEARSERFTFKMASSFTWLVPQCFSLHKFHLIPILNKSESRQFCYRVDGFPKHECAKRLRLKLQSFLWFSPRHHVSHILLAKPATHIQGQRGITLHLSMGQVAKKLWQSAIYHVPPFSEMRDFLTFM